MKICWFGWILDPRLHVSLLAWTIGLVAVLERRAAPSDPEWRVTQTAVFRGERAMPPIPKVGQAPAPSAEDALKIAGELAEARDALKIAGELAEAR